MTAAVSQPRYNTALLSSTAVWGRFEGAGRSLSCRDRAIYTILSRILQAAVSSVFDKHWPRWRPREYEEDDVLDELERWD
jgi:hypothetical protein